MKFTVDRKTWFRGNGHAHSSLLKENGLRCCLGFVGNQSGIPDDEMIGEGIPSEVLPDKWPKWLIRKKRPSASCYKAMETNDDPTMQDARRETIIKTIFSKHGDEIEFIN